MKIITSVNEMRALSSQARIQSQTIGLVPTMGALHQGHMSLIDHAREANDFIIVSIFVNPKQFAANEDLDKYPKNNENDIRLCKEHNVDALFMPDINEIYPHTFQTSVEVTGLDNNMCGKNRPGHFKGVTTIVTKLFNITMPDKAYFGQKDWQQCAIIKKMNTDLNFGIDIITCQTIRDSDGLALSSRNTYLSNEERSSAATIPYTLHQIENIVRNGEKNVYAIKQIVIKELSDIKNLNIEYIVIVEPDTLQELDIIESTFLAAIAVKLGSTRLIDNILIEI